MKETRVAALRRKYSNTQINLVDMVRLFDPTKNKIMTDVLMREYLERAPVVTQNYVLSERIERAANFEHPTEKEIFKRNRYLYALLEMILDIVGEQSIYYLKQFEKYRQSGKLPDNNIESYKRLDDIKKVVHVLDLEESLKQPTIKIMKVYDSDEWVVVMPLSLQSSVTYGAGTRWCTTTVDGGSYYSYSQNGLLYYIINRKTNMKYAYNRKAQSGGSPGDIKSEFFNAADERIDSMDVDVPFEVLAVIRNHTNQMLEQGITTMFMLPEFDVKAYEKWMDENTPKKLSEVPMADPPIQGRAMDETIERVHREYADGGQAVPQVTPMTAMNGAAA